MRFKKHVVIYFSIFLVSTSKHAVDGEASADNFSRIANVVGRADHFLAVRGSGQDNVLAHAWYDESILVAALVGVPHERHWVGVFEEPVGEGTPKTNFHVPVLHLPNSWCLLHIDIHRIECDDMFHGVVEETRDISAGMYGFRLGVNLHALEIGVTQGIVLLGNGVRVVAGHGDSEGARKVGGHETDATNNGKRLPPR